MYIPYLIILLQNAITNLPSNSFNLFVSLLYTQGV